LIHQRYLSGSGCWSLRRLHALNLRLDEGKLLPYLRCLGGGLRCLLTCSKDGSDPISFLLHGLQLCLELLKFLLGCGCSGLLDLRYRLLIMSFCVIVILKWCSIGAINIASWPCIFGRGCWPPRWCLPLSYHCGFVSARPRWAPMLGTGPSRIRNVGDGNLRRAAGGGYGAN
jgi:hypothetical protein